MHLLEALLVLSEATGEARFKDLASEIAGLFRNTLLQKPANILPEYFTDEFQPLTDPERNWLEPGHQFEWAWILAHYQMMSGEDHADIVRALVEGAERCGVDPQTQLTYNSASLNQMPLDRTSRTWPNTERIKGWLGLYELTGTSPWAAVESACEALFTYHLGKTAPSGMWLDVFDADGKACVTKIPSSTLYHVFLAFAEVLRLADRAPGKQATNNTTSLTSSL